MKSRYFGFLAVLLICFSTMVALFAQAPKDQPAKKPADKAAAQPAAAQQNAAERVFQANCSRCHYAPEQIPARITGTVVRHMRVRANLSTAEEQLILHYLSP